MQAPVTMHATQVLEYGQAKFQRMCQHARHAHTPFQTSTICSKTASTVAFLLHVGQQCATMLHWRRLFENTRCCRVNDSMSGSGTCLTCTHDLGWRVQGSAPRG